MASATQNKGFKQTCAATSDIPWPWTSDEPWASPSYLFMTAEPKMPERKHQNFVERKLRKMGR